MILEAKFPYIPSSSRYSHVGIRENRCLRFYENRRKILAEELLFLSSFSMMSYNIFSERICWNCKAAWRIVSMRAALNSPFQKYECWWWSLFFRLKSTHIHLLGKSTQVLMMINPSRPYPGPWEKINLTISCWHFFEVPQKVLWRL